MYRDYLYWRVPPPLQHPYLEDLVGKPHVCSARLEDIDAVKTCVLAALDSDLSPMIPKELTHEAYVRLCCAVNADHPDHPRHPHHHPPSLPTLTTHPQLQQPDRDHLWAVPPQTQLTSDQLMMDWVGWGDRDGKALFRRKPAFSRRVIGDET